MYIRNYSLRSYHYSKNANFSSSNSKSDFSYKSSLENDSQNNKRSKREKSKISIKSNKSENNINYFLPGYSYSNNWDFTLNEPFLQSFNQSKCNNFFSNKFNSQEKIRKDEPKIVNKSIFMEKWISKSNSSDQIKKKEIEKDLDNLNINKNMAKTKKPNKIKNNKMTKTTDINTFNPNILNFEEGKDNNHFLNKKRTNKKRPKHDKEKIDNIYQKIKNAFFNSIFALANQKLARIIKDAAFEKIIPFLENLYNKKEFKNALSKKVKDLLYISNDLEFLILNKSKQKYKNKKYINKCIDNNKNNLKIIEKIEKMKNNINKKNYIKIKDNILILYRLLFNTSLKDMYLQYITLDNKKRLFENFDTIAIEFDKIREEKNKDINYLIKFSDASIKLIFDEDKKKQKEKKKEYFKISK